MDQIVLGMEVGLSPGDLEVLDGDPAPSPKRGHPQFSAHVYCAQEAGCITMPLGMEVGLSPGDFVFDGDPAPHPQKGGGALSPIFGPCLSWPNGWIWIKMALGMEVGLGPAHIVLDGEPAPLSQKGGPQFSAHFYCRQTAGESRWHLAGRWALVQATLC